MYVFRNICIYVITIKEKEVIDLRESMGDIGGRNGKGKMI